MAKLTTEMKYKLYESSVQNHLADIDFINDEFKRIKKRKPLSLREDFGGTAALACDWVKQSKAHRSWAIDLDKEPQEYGKKTHYKKLSDDEQKRIQYVKGNVLSPQKEKTDVVVAFNFSYFIFKKRKELLEYFIQVKNL